MVDAHLGTTPWRVDEATLADVDGYMIHSTTANAEKQQFALMA